MPALPSPSRKPRFPYRRLLLELVLAEMKLRDQGTALGFLWTLLHPVLMFTVLYMLFIKWVGKFVDQYAVYLLVGIVLWSFFQRATSVAVVSFNRQRLLIMNYRFPREIVVLSPVLAVFWSTLLEFAVLLPCLWLILGVAPRWAWCFLPVLLLVLLALTAGFSLFLAVLGAEYQDMDRIWAVLSSAMFYLTPIFYPMSIIAEGRQKLLLLSPLTQLLIDARACLMQGQAPRLEVLAGLAVLAALSVVAGLGLVRSYQYRLVDRLMV